MGLSASTNGGTQTKAILLLRLTLNGRNFLLFLPATKPNLRAVLSYYSSTVKLDAEGDVHLTSDTAEGLGRHLFFESLFESIPAIGQSSRAQLFPLNL